MNWLAKFINFFTENSFSIIDLWFIFHISSAIEASNWADVVVMVLPRMYGCLTIQERTMRALVTASLRDNMQSTATINTI